MQNFADMKRSSPPRAPSLMVVYKVGMYDLDPLYPFTAKVAGYTFDISSL